MLFGAGAQFFRASGPPSYGNGVFDLDQLGGSRPYVIGYIVGGIMSTLPNTNTQSDTAASPYIFKVMLTSTLTPPVSGISSIPALSRGMLVAAALLVGVLGSLGSRRAGYLQRYGHMPSCSPVSARRAGLFKGDI